jgi:hypothetical protein
MRTILLVLGDTHSGHKLGLMAPDTALYDQDELGNVISYIPELTAFQKYLWDEVFIPGIDQVNQWAKGDPVVILHGGDICHGNKYPEQLVSTRLDDQYEIAIKALGYLLNIRNIRSIRLIFGTASHEFGEGSAALRISQQLSISYPETDIKAIYHGLADVDGVMVDYAHHGPGKGIRIYLHGNNARYYLTDIILKCVVNGEIPPDLVLRHHTHQKIYETVRMGNYQSRILVVPSLCGLGDYGQKVSRSDFELTVGMFAFEIVDGKLKGELDLTTKLDLRTREKL